MPPRVKESCQPCRQRKTRCDSGQPCSPCVLRGTETDCRYNVSASRPAFTPLANAASDVIHTSSGSTDSRIRASTGPGVSDSNSASKHSSRAIEELNRVKASIAALEAEVHRLESVEEIVIPATLDEKAVWERVLGELPGRATCEILLEYLIQECDWLLHIGDPVSVWHSTIARAGCSTTTAGLLCLWLAIPAFLLSESQSTLYRLPAPVDHARLVELAKSFLPPVLATVSDIELIYGIAAYIIYSGGGFMVSKFTEPAMIACAEQGFLDEGGASWTHLTPKERDDRRRVVWNVIGGNRWKLLYLEDDALMSLRINVCQPQMRPTALDKPVRLNLQRHIDLAEPSYRVLRIKSQLEQHRVARHREIKREFSELLPRVRAYQMDLKGLTEASAGQCEALYRELMDWRERRLPMAGFVFEDIDPTDIVSCRYAALAMGLRSSVGHLCANILRPWLHAPESRLYAACLENAEWTTAAIPHIKTLLQSRQVPCMSTVLSANLFNAATTFAVPVIRALRIWTTKDPEEVIRTLPAWPAHVYPRRAGEPIDNPAAPPVLLPAAIYIDSKIRDYATHILVILDTLSLLNVNLLGQAAEHRLALLVRQYGLRDSQLEPWPTPDPLPPAETGTEWMAAMDAEPPTASFDPGFLQSLLQMDGSLWDELLTNR